MATVASRLFAGEECLVCGHLRGDHEWDPATRTYACDDDCDHDVCTPVARTTDTTSQQTPTC